MITPLSETDVHVLFQEDGEVFLFDKEENKDLWRIAFHGNVTVGFLGLVNDWGLVGGDRLLLWKNNELKFIDDPELVGICDIREVEDDVVEIDTHPPGENPVTFRFNIETEKKERISKD